MSGNRVLLVDDEQEAVVEPLVEAFAAAGAAVDIASSWEDAYQKFLLGGHRVVLADWNLPGSKNGLLLLARLKQLRPGARLVLFSGYLDDDQREEIESLPFVDRAVAKGNGLTEALYEEVEAAMAFDEGSPVDWVELATGYRTAADIEHADIEALELRLRGGTS